MDDNLVTTSAPSLGVAHSSAPRACSHGRSSWSRFGGVGRRVRKIESLYLSVKLRGRARLPTRAGWGQCKSDLARLGRYRRHFPDRPPGPSCGLSNESLISEPTAKHDDRRPRKLVERVEV